MSTPTIYTIAPGEAFVDALARGIIQSVGDAPEALARVRVLLPTRRACRSLREAFLRLSEGRAMLLPQMTPLGDVDEDGLVLEGADVDDALQLPPAIGALNRQVLLARYVLQMDPTTTPDQALRLAGELAKLVDQVHTEGLDLARLPALVKDEQLSQHWDKTVQFLAIVGETWPQVLSDMGALDPAQRRDLLLRARAQAWQANPPPGPVIAAGSTGSIPATAELLNVVARLDQGSVVLPGLDTAAPDRVWATLDPTHPQYGMAQLLHKLGVARADVQDWPGSGTDDNARRQLLDLALVPADATPLWRDARFDSAAALDGLTRIECDGVREEATTIALILRSALEEPEKYPGRTAALITPDRQLARRVAVELKRWDIEVDDSAGQPLDQTPPGAFFNLVADMAADRFHPVGVLACLKHPLAAGGMAPADLRTCARALEAACLRGSRPDGGLKGLEDRLRVHLRDDYARRHFERMGFRETDVTAALHALKTCAQPLADALAGRAPVPAAELLEAHTRAAEALAQTGAQTDAPTDERRLWAGDAGDALSTFIAEAHDALAHLAPLLPEQYPALIRALMVGRAVRPGYAPHPRVHIWGLLEARLQRADVVVLGGLNEGTWPAEPDPSPWMSRPMMREFGLPLPERRIGLSAHDFVQAASAGQVFITRAARQGTSPQVPSRWLTRLDTVLADAKPQADATWPAWADSLTQAQRAPQPCDPPRPCPPVAARPRKLSVTAIEKWIRDPYSIYARYILGLQPLDPIDADASAADKGNVIHEVLERFVKQHMTELPADPVQALLDIGTVVFREEISSPGVRAFWWPRFVRIAHWFAAFEQKRRDAGIVPALIEGRGSLDVDGFMLTAKADRMDRSATGLTIIDYKTGQPPSAKQVDSGFAPQLPLEGAIVKGGGFAGLPRELPIEGLLYVKLSGAREAGKETLLKLDAEQAVQDAYEGLSQLILQYDDEKTPYLSRPRVKFENDYGDYDHLARLKEWRSADDGGDA